MFFFIKKNKLPVGHHDKSLYYPVRGFSSFSFLITNY